MSNETKVAVIVPICTGAFCAVGLLISIVVALIIRAQGFYDIFGIGPFIGPIILGSIMALGVLGSIIVFLVLLIRRNKQQDIDSYSGYSGSSETIYPFDDDGNVIRHQRPSPQGYSSQYYGSQDIKRKMPQVRQAVDEDDNVNWRKIQPLIFQEKIGQASFCEICKLPLELGDFIMQCPNCQALYHGDHLIEWLLQNGHCPRCKAEIDIS